MASGAAFTFNDPKMLALISLAEKKEVISFNELKSAIGFDTDEALEQFLVEAIHQRVINGRINGVQREFVVTFYQRRAIDRAQWEQMHSRLASLITSLRGCRDIIHQSIKFDAQVFVKKGMMNFFKTAVQSISTVAEMIPEGVMDDRRQTVRNAVTLLNKASEYFPSSTSESSETPAVKITQEPLQSSNSEVSKNKQQHKREDGQDVSLYHEFSKELFAEIVRDRPELVSLPDSKGGLTPLHYSCRRGDLTCARLLLAHGAKVNAKDSKKNTPLHSAIRRNSLSVVQLLLCFGADPTILNEEGISAFALPSSDAIKNLFAQVRKWNKLDAEVVADRHSRLSAALLKTPNTIEQACQQSAIAYKLSVEPPKPGAGRVPPFRLLSMDGGGIRGLVCAQILFELQRRFESATRTSINTGASKFIEPNFDWLAGTSTGAILALGLANELSPLECLRMYLRLKDDVFDPQSGRPYSAEKFESFLRKIFGKRLRMSELGASKRSKLRVLVTATKANCIPLELDLYRNYNGGVGAPTTDLEVWRAARRSSAAPTFFPKADEYFLDGGLMANNPSGTLFREVSRYRMERELTGGHSQSGAVSTGDYIAFFVSIGTGRQPEKTLSSTDICLRRQQQLSGEQAQDSEANGDGWSFDFIKNLANNPLVTNFWALASLKDIFVEQLTASDGLTVAEMETRAHENRVPFFRFSPQLEEHIELDETDDERLVRMLWTTKVYMNEHCRADVDLLIALMEHFHGI